MVDGCHGESSKEAENCNLLLVYLIYPSKNLVADFERNDTSPFSCPSLCHVSIFSFCHSQLLLTSTLLLPRFQRLHIPNHIRILLNTPITTEKTHTRHARNALANPLLILVRLIDHLLRFAVARKVIADKVIIAVVDDGVAESGEAVGVAKGV